MDERVANVGKAWTTQLSTRATMHEAHPSVEQEFAMNVVGLNREVCSWDDTCWEISMQLSVLGYKEALQDIKTLRVDANMAVTEIENFFWKFLDRKQLFG